MTNSEESSLNTDCVSQVEIYSYCDDKKGNIEITLFVDQPGRHKLVIEEKYLKRMQIVAEIGKKITIR